MMKKPYFLIILIVILLGVGFFFFVFKIQELAKKEIKTETPAPAIITPQDLGAGSVGEITVKDEKTGKDIPLVTAILPPVIFSTAGTIIEVKSDGLVIQGGGSNFADGTPRTINIIFTDSSKTFEKNYLKNYLGKAGLKFLKPGMEILIDSQDNIRGKTEFQAKTINILR